MMLGRNYKGEKKAREIDSAKQCPACGAYSVSFRGHFKPLGFAVRCNHCHFEGEVSADKRMAVSLWNELERKTE